MRSARMETRAWAASTTSGGQRTSKRAPGSARACLALLSGRNHKVLTAVAVASPADLGGAVAVRLVETRVQFKRLTAGEIDDYVASGEWRGKAGGYGVQGRAGGFVIGLHGSYTGVVGLPLYETLNLLEGRGFRRASAP